MCLSVRTCLDETGFPREARDLFCAGDTTHQHHHPTGEHAERQFLLAGPPRRDAGPLEKQFPSRVGSGRDAGALRCSFPAGDGHDAEPGPAVTQQP